MQELYLRFLRDFCTIFASTANTFNLSQMGGQKQSYDTKRAITCFKLNSNNGCRIDVETTNWRRDIIILKSYLVQPCSSCYSCVFFKISWLYCISIFRWEKNIKNVKSFIWFVFWSFLISVEDFSVLDGFLGPNLYIHKSSKPQLPETSPKRWKHCAVWNSL